MKSIIFSAITFIASPVFAGVSPGHIFMCKVTGFDKKEVKGQCDPSRPKALMKIPREWLAEDNQVKMNKRVKFILDDKQYGQWLAMNNLEMPKGKSK